MFKVAWSPIYKLDLPPKHRFPMEKYELLPKQLIYEGTLNESNFFEPGTLDEKDILRVHSPNYWSKLENQLLTKAEIRRTGFPLSKQLIIRETVIAKGTIECSLYALKYGVSMNIAGGTHHAYPDRGEGFCLLNDIGIAASYLLEKKLVKKVLVIDLDVHQGNGTASMFKGNKEVFTLSIHGENNYPLKKELSDLDVALPDHTGDSFYLEKLYKSLEFVFNEFSPDFVYYQSGVDVLRSDKLGRLGMSIDGCRKRDHLVLNKCYSHSVPLVACMGGGYSEKISIIVDAHANTYREAVSIFF